MLHTNVRTLVKNVSKLEELLSDMHYKPDLIAVTETWIKPSRLPKVQIRGYAFMHVDSVNADSNGTGLAGGVGLCVKECLIVTPCKDTDLETNDCENLWVDIQLKSEKTLILGIVYRHPKSNLVEFQEKTDRSVYHLHKLKKTFYICGDFNIDLMQYDKNKFVLYYFNILHSQGCISLTTYNTNK